MSKQIHFPTDLKELEDDLLKQINHLRHHPKQWIVELKRMLDYFQGDTYDHPLFGSRHYNKGRAAIEEAIKFLETCAPMPALNRNAQLDALAKKENERAIALESNKQEVAEHSVAKRISAIDKKFINYAESVVVGFPDVKEIVKDLILHDGIVDYPHREHLLSQDFDQVGINIAKNKNDELSTLVNFLRTDPGDYLDTEVSKYDLPLSEYPDEYVSVRRNFYERIINGKKHVEVTYEFTLPDGKRVTKSKHVDE